MAHNYDRDRMKDGEKKCNMSSASMCSGDLSTRHLNIGIRIPGIFALGIQMVKVHQMSELSKIPIN